MLTKEELLKPRFVLIPERPDGMYSICDEGYVINNFTGKILKHYMNRKSNGYAYVKLRISKTEAKSCHVGVLVGKAFVDNADSKPCINHIDGDKMNNNFTNLEWVTYKENSQHAHRKGLGKINTEDYNSRLSQADIWHIKDLKQRGLRNFELARFFDVTEMSIKGLTLRNSYRNAVKPNLNLLTPRFVVKSIYPFCPYSIGDIIVAEKNGRLFKTVSEFGNIFSPLEWWQHREVKDMPEKVLDTDGTTQTVTWLLINDHLVMRIGNIDLLASNVICFYQPA